MMQRMKLIGQNYSKARNKQDISFEADGETKRQSASPKVVEAAQTFAGDIYQQLETLSGRNHDHEEGARRWDTDTKSKSKGLHL